MHFHKFSRISTLCVTLHNVFIATVDTIWDTITSYTIRVGYLAKNEGETPHMFLFQATVLDWPWCNVRSARQCKNHPEKSRWRISYEQCAWKEWRLIEKQGRVDQSEHRYYSNGLNALQGSRTTNDSGKYKLMEISWNNISRKIRF